MRTTALLYRGHYQRPWWHDADFECVYYYEETIPPHIKAERSADLITFYNRWKMQIAHTTPEIMFPSSSGTTYLWQKANLFSKSRFYCEVLRLLGLSINQRYTDRQFSKYLQGPIDYREPGAGACSAAFFAC
jgi:hypothetical protein